MSEDNKDDFFDLLNSISSEIAYKILNLYSTTPKGLSLTETSSKIEEKTSTVRDHLNKLLTMNLIYKKEKSYFLSNFGSFILSYLKNLEIFNKTRKVFGQIPAELIPSEFIQELVPHIADVQVQSDQWQFMSISHRLMSKIEDDLGTPNNELKLLGWGSLDISVDIIKNNFKKLSFNASSLQEFLENTNFQLISSKGILTDIKKDSLVEQFLQQTSIKERILICEKVEDFKFTLFKYNDVIQIFLTEGDKLGVGHHFILENKSEAVEFFDNVFNYYKKQSIPMSRYLNQR